MKRWSLLLSIVITTSLLAELVVEPKSVEVGGTVTVKGDGFSQKEKVLLDFCGATKTIASSEAGNFEAILTVPIQIGGHKIIIATGSTSKKVDQGTTFISPNVEMRPKEGHVGTKVKLIGMAFGAGERIQIGLGKRNVVAIVDNASPLGTFSAEFVIEGQPKGENRLFAIGHSTYFMAQATFFMKTTTKLSSEEGKVGSRLLISGNGFTPGNTVKIDFGKIETIALATVDPNGSFQTDFSVPRSLGGKQEILMTSNPEPSSYTASFRVLPTFTGLSPDRGFVGSLINPDISGLASGENLFIGFGDKSDYSTFTVGGDGSFVTGFPVDTQPGGLKIITIKSTLSKIFQTMPFTIKPNIYFVSPEEAAPGDIILAKGNGFRKDEKIRIDFRTEGIKWCTGDDSGSFEIEFCAPDAEGNIRLAAIGYESRSAATTYINIKKKVEEKPEGEKKE
ncbi:MAG: IPT/TIG domain-containing protein [bacterium]|nr:IPT/TIG domain-containing protein [bacterium]